MSIRLATIVLMLLVSRPTSRCAHEVNLSSPLSRPQVAKQSKAAMSMCLWVRAMDTYAKVIKIVEPKRNILRVAQVGLPLITWVHTWQ